MTGLIKQRFCIRNFHDASKVHDDHPVADMLHDAQIVADKKRSQGQFQAQLVEKIYDLGLDGCVSAETTSSQTRKSGFTANARQMAMRCLCPPEN